VVEPAETCVHPYCHRPPRLCDVDHIVPYAEGGPTSLDNLASSRVDLPGTTLPGPGRLMPTGDGPPGARLTQFHATCSCAADARGSSSFEESVRHSS
jgi:hypothetical protein